MKNLVIVESPNKIKKISEFLGPNYVVEASVGHIFKLETSGAHGLGVDTTTWTPKYKVDAKKRSVVKKLKAAVKDKDKIYIATDPDREGEAIGGNIVDVLGIKDNYQRLVYYEITKEAIQNSLKNPGKLDQDLINSQKTRRILDRIIGFRLSKLVHSKIKNSPMRVSAGRVQSIALKLIVDKEQIIADYVPTEYSKIFAELGSGDTIEYFNKDQTFFNEDKTKTWIERNKKEELLDEIYGDLKVIKIQKSKKTGKNYIPLDQASLYATGSSRYGMGSRSIERASQKLYEQGLISYPRTDSLKFSNNFVKLASAHILKSYGKDYLKPYIPYKPKKKSKVKSQEAHEAIRPTDINNHPNSIKTKYALSSSEFNTYKVIYERSLQVLMNSPIYENTKYVLQCNASFFKFNNRKITFDGYLAIEKEKHDSKSLDDILEKVNGKQLKQINLFPKVGDTLKVNKYFAEDFATKPPSLYNDGTLIKTLKLIGVGRPSTYSSTIQRNIQRKYIEKVKGKGYKSTNFGRLVLEKLRNNFSTIINEQYTAKIEKELDDIANGTEDFKKILNDFYKRFELKLSRATETMQLTKIEFKKTGLKCKKCNSDLIFRYNKKGQKFIGCSGFPKCRVAFSNIEEAKHGKKPPKSTGIKCPNCKDGILVYKKNWRGSEFVACPNYPKCKTAFKNTDEAKKANKNVLNGVDKNLNSSKKQTKNSKK